jgi:hypothetical protein
MSDEKTFCRKCGTEIKEEDLFCSKCGNALSAPIESIPATKNPTHRSLWFFGLTVLFLLIIASHFHTTSTANSINPVNNNVESDSLSSTPTSINDLKNYVPAPVYKPEQNKMLDYPLTHVANDDNCQFSCETLGNKCHSSTAPKGYSYYAVIVSINNEGNNPISTNPYYWKLNDNDVTYSIDPATFSFDNPIREVNSGGHAVFTLIYLVEYDKIPDYVELFYEK